MMRDGNLLCQTLIPAIPQILLFGLKCVRAELMQRRTFTISLPLIRSIKKFNTCENVPPLNPLPQWRKSDILSRWAWYTCGYLRMTLCGMTVFSGGVKQCANFSSQGSCSFTESLCWVVADFISACILMMPGVIISPKSSNGCCH